jgi:hypothetical protein
VVPPQAMSDATNAPANSATWLGPSRLVKSHSLARSPPAAARGASPTLGPSAAAGAPDRRPAYARYARVLGVRPRPRTGVPRRSTGILVRTAARLPWDTPSSCLSRSHEP